MGIEGLRKCFIILSLTLLIACLLLPGPSLARTEARYELRIGNAVFGNDLYSSRSQQSLFHQQTANLIDIESLNIDFPAFADGLHLGPTTTAAGAGSGFDMGTGIGTDSAGIGAGNSLGIGAGTTASANIVPFGLVNLAFPDISQTVLQSYDVSSTGFYQATFLGIPPPNDGAYPVVSGPAAFSSPIAPSMTIAGPTSPFPEMLNIMPGYDRQKAITKRNADKAKSTTTAKNAATNTTSAGDNSILVNRSLGDLSINGSVVRAQQAGQGTSETISGQEIAGAETSVPMNYTGQDTYDSKLSYPYFPFNAKAGQISNMSMLDRMWRNSHLGTMGRAYEGDISAPVWILPTEFTKSAIAMYNWYDVNNMALAYTLPDMHLEPRFWGLGIANPTNPSYGIIQNMINKIAPASLPAAKPNAAPAATNKSESLKLLNLSMDDLIKPGDLAINARLNTTPSANATGNVTSGGNKSSAAKPTATPEPTKAYIPAGGPAGQGQGWPIIIKGPFEKGWLGGGNNPWVTGAPTNPVFPGMGGPDWPPYYWGFGRYKGY